jgi:hypothetical protein
MAFSWPWNVPSQLKVDENSHFSPSQVGKEYIMETPTELIEERHGQSCHGLLGEITGPG